MIEKRVRICLVDDHKLLRKGMVELIDNLPGYMVVGDVDNGKILMNLLASMELPDIILLDINMPEMNGFETAVWLTKEFPQIKILALSMYDDERSIIRMIKSGAKGYVLKDADPRELKRAFDDLISRGYYHSDLVSNLLVSSLNTGPATAEPLLNERELIFLKLACTEMTYKEIADKMNLSPRTIDGYREALFEKLRVKSRVGLVIYALTKGIVMLPDQSRGEMGSRL
ncbi:MAG: DNA-binding response regulator [Cytophaga sp.]|nr:DNA-binding response regulator [Cytophaga sp.]